MIHFHKIQVFANNGNGIRWPFCTLIDFRYVIKLINLNVNEEIDPKYEKALSYQASPLNLPYCTFSIL